MTLVHNLYKTILGGGVAAGVVGGVVLGFVKLKHEIRTRNKSIDIVWDSCPLSHNFDRIVEMQNQKDEKMKKEEDVANNSMAAIIVY